jgi:hypothetical protein
VLTRRAPFHFTAADVEPVRLAPWDRRACLRRWGDAVRDGDRRRALHDLDALAEELAPDLPALHDARHAPDARTAVACYDALLRRLLGFSL